MISILTVCAEAAPALPASVSAATAAPANNVRNRSGPLIMLLPNSQAPDPGHSRPRRPVYRESRRWGNVPEEAAGAVVARMERSVIRGLHKETPPPHFAEFIIGRRFAPTRWLNAGYESRRYPAFMPRTIGWPMPSGFESSSTKAARAVSWPRLTQAWWVPRWTSTSPALSRTVD